MHLVIGEMREFHHVNIPDRDILVELLAGIAIPHHDLARHGELGFFHRFLYVLLGSPIENRGGDLYPECPGRPSELGFQELAYIHTARHAKRVEHDVKRSPIRKERHILHRQYLRDNTFVPVSSGHLVPGLELLLAGDIYRYPPQDTRGKFIPVLYAVKVPFHLGHRLLKLAVYGDYHAVKLSLQFLVVLHVDIIEVRFLELGKVRLGYFLAGFYENLPSLEVLKVAYKALTYYLLMGLLGFPGLKDLEYVLIPLFYYLTFLVILALLVFCDRFYVLSRKFFYIDYYPFYTGRNPQGNVSHVARLLPEYGSQQFFLRREFRFRFRGDLTDEYAPG